MKKHFHKLVISLACLYAITLSGCTSILAPISGIPAHRLPPTFLASPKNGLVPIDIARLRQEPPREYLVDADDILGIYIEGVLGSAEEAPPVHMPERDSDLPPSIGFPIPVRKDGTLPLPLITPIATQGLTLTQIENAIRAEYTVKTRILQPGKDRIIVTLMKERTYRIIVMRQDGIGGSNDMRFERGGINAGGFVQASNQTTRGDTIDLPAYKNDVLHALADTGGLPGLDAKNEIKILKGRLMDARKRDEFIRAFYAAPVCNPCVGRPPLPDDPAIIRIPLRLPPGQTPTFTEKNIILEDGDIVLIEGREREVFYTGGLLPGGEWPLPRDYDLDVLGALAMAGQGAGGQPGVGRSGGVAGFNVQSMGGAPPSMLFVLRKLPNNGQITIAVDLNRAMNDPKARPLVQPGDTLILQYKPEEELVNFGIGSFFTFGITELFRSGN